nr:WYL domain-containing protein [Streptomyces sp. SID8014]
MGIVLKGGLWYLVAASGERADGPVRTYRIARPAEAVVTGTRFARPEGFGPAAYWARSAERLAAGAPGDGGGAPVAPRGGAAADTPWGRGGEAVESAGEPDAAVARTVAELAGRYRE